MIAPLFVAISVEVEKDRTSTITTTSLIGASSETPFAPHSQRRLNSSWSKIIFLVREFFCYFYAISTTDRVKRVAHLSNLLWS
jgi:hypothetical protein